MLRDEWTRLADEAAALRAVGYRFEPNVPKLIATTQQSYLNGLQLEFTDPVRGRDVAVQLVGQASALEVKAVISLEAPYLRTTNPRSR